MEDSILKLIKEITPLYNTYIESKRSISGMNALNIMWDIGEILDKYINKYGTKPHKLYRLVYGKSEGSSNIIQRSYITREFLGRCFRIKHIFESKDQIEFTFPNLRSFTLFRESMPFFDNPKYIMNPIRKNEIIKLLNSEEDPKIILNKIRILQKTFIGKTNPRTQRLHELDLEKDIFVKSYNEIYELIKIKDFKRIQYNLQGIKQESLENISAILGALVSEEVIVPSIIVNGSEPEPFGSLAKVLIKLFANKIMTERNRFRRLVQPDRISKLSSMVYALTSEQILKNYK